MISSTSIKVKNQLSRRNMIGYGIQSIKSVSWSIVRSVDRSVGRSVGRLVGRSVGRSIQWISNISSDRDEP